VIGLEIKLPVMYLAAAPKDFFFFASKASITLDLS